MNRNVKIALYIIFWPIAVYKIAKWADDKYHIFD